MAMVGPLELLVLAFPGSVLPDRVGVALRTVEVSGDVRVVDAIAVGKDAGGVVTSHELGDIAVLADVATHYGLADMDTSLIDAADVEEIGVLLTPGSTAVALLVEHAWARETAESVWDLGGVLLASVRIPPAYAQEALELGRGGRRDASPVA
jgi:hypothetical protein